MLGNSVGEVSIELPAARALLKGEDFEGALRKGVELLGTSVIDPDVWVLMAEALLGKNAFNEASEAVRTALDLRPNHPETLVVLGKIQRSLGNIPDSIDTFRVAISLDEQCLIAMREMHNSVFALEQTGYS